MSTPVDRGALEKAIEWLEERHNPEGPTVAILLAAARAHLDTLPRTKMVEVWRVEGAIHGSPHICNASTRDEAERIARNHRATPDFACVKVTGPHQQCVPA